MLIGCCATMDDYTRIREIGYDYIELSGREICQMDQESFEKVKNTIIKGGLLCLALNAYCPPSIIMAGDGYNLKKIKKYAQLCSKRASELGVNKVGIGSPNSRHLPKGYDRKRALNQIADFFRVTALEFEKYGITICIEALGPCYCNFINTVNEAKELCDYINLDHVKLVIDFYNMEHNKEADMPLENLMNVIEHVHISDDDGNPFRRYFMKREKFELHKKRLKSLKDNGYKEMISVEIDLPVDTDLAKESLKLIRESIR